MESVKDFLDSMKSYLRGRFSNPLYAAYFFAWSYLNFRLLMVIFGEGSWKEKITYIDGSLFSQNWHWWWYGFAYPLCIAVAYVAFAPFAYRWVTVFVKERDKLTVEKLMQIAGDTPLPNEAANRLRKKILQLESENKLQESQSQQNVDELTAQLELLKQENLNLLEKLKAGGLSAEGVTGRGELSDGSIALEKDEIVTSVDSISDKPTGRKASLKLKRTFEFGSGQFVGVNQSDVLQLNDAGLTGEEILALYRLRNATPIEIANFAHRIEAQDSFSSQVIYDRLLGLALLRRIPNSNKCDLTTLGRQLLDTLMEKGVVEKLLLEVD